MKKYLILVALFLSINSYANFQTLDELFKACEAPVDPKMSEVMLESQCLGYVAGVIDASQVIFSVRPTSLLFCLPEGGVTPDLALKATKKWVKAHPKDSAGTTARMGLIIGLAQSYPCR
ncbi:Rap1a/Tai family immunity protein [Teredinibacter franksiae]|uniref:Rap1a/Tai family immunity protein n=1 Tax=Teredinibacter franksiae TaxID=2761453 RepID=UPI00162899FA|nr:Rap1a/Tai family immunity protein [Teredinibacter franksiae]